MTTASRRGLSSPTVPAATNWRPTEAESTWPSYTPRPVWGSRRSLVRYLGAFHLKLPGTMSTSNSACRCEGGSATKALGMSTKPGRSGYPSATTRRVGVSVGRWSRLRLACPTPDLAHLDHPAALE